MRKVLLLAGLSMMSVLVFAPAAFAEHTPEHVAATQADCSENYDPITCPAPGEGGVPVGTEPGDSYSSTSASANPCPDPDFPRQTPDGCQASNLPDVERGSDASASASATATASATASAAADSQYEAELPKTGGAAPLALVSAVALLAGGGLLAFGIVRRR